MTWTKHDGVWHCTNEIGICLARVWPIGDQGWQAQSTARVGVHSEMRPTPGEALNSLVEQMEIALAQVTRVADSWGELAEDFGGEP